MMDLTFDNIPHKLDTSIQLPASKSLSNRALVLKALSGDQFSIHNLSEAEDTTQLQSLIRQDWQTINCGNAGTVFRFLTAYYAMHEGTRILEGDDRMRERPIAPLVSALRELGATINYLEEEGYPPLQVEGGQLTGGEVTMDASVSSQFVTALLLIAPFTTKGIHIVFSGIPVSRPYFAMTIKILEYFNVKVRQKSNEVAVLPKQKWPSKSITIEPDWTSASYWIGLAGILPDSHVTFPDLRKRSWQGDHAMLDLAKGFGLSAKPNDEGLQVVSSDKKPAFLESFLTDHPDLVPSLVAMCTATEVPFHFLGLAHLRDKETNRLSALQTEMGKAGAHIQVESDALRCNEYDPSYQEVIINTHQDHRMAMSSVLLATRIPELSIKDPEVVEKSYPGFWDQLKATGFSFRYSKEQTS